MNGRTWGLISLSIAFVWQLYTLWLLVHLHESPEAGIRYSRYLQLCFATFGIIPPRVHPHTVHLINNNIQLLNIPNSIHSGEKVGKWVAFFPIMYLSAGTCTTLIIIGGSTARTFYEVVCGDRCSSSSPLTTVEWYLIFTCGAVVLSQLPNLNSIAGVSLVGAVTAVGYCTSIWAVSLAQGRLAGVSYEPVRGGSQLQSVFTVLNALGIVAFAFRGHNLILEIQVCGWWMVILFLIFMLS